MTTVSDPRSGGFSSAPPIVAYDEPPVKPPPILAVGALAWIRKNLFNTWFDTLLTIVSSIFAVSAIIGFLQWAVTQANWLVIIFNLRQLMVGRYELSADWRAQLVVLLIAFVAGFTVSIWARISRSLVIFVIVLLALSFILPAAISALIPRPAAYFAVGNIEVVSGGSSQTPQPALAFVARAGETITVEVADAVAADDQSLSQLSGFADDATNNALNVAKNRLTTLDRIDELEQLLVGDLLTVNQREQLTGELEGLEETPPAIEQYAINQNAVTVRILRGTTLEVIGEATLEGGGTPLSVTLPEEGWYIIEKTLTGDGVTLLRATGIYPFLERNFSLTGDLEQGTSAGRVSQFIRVFDIFLTEENRPQIDGSDVPYAIITNNQYRGEHSFSDYLRVFLGPFLSQINLAFTLIVIAAALGYAASKAADRFFSPPESPRRASLRSATWLLVVTPILMFILVYGVGGPLPITDTRLWGGLMLTLMLTTVGIIASFPIGILLALGRRSSLPVISTVCTLYIEFVRGVPLIAVLFMAQLLIPLVNPALAEVDNVFRAMAGIILFSAAYLAENVRGGLQSIPPGQEEAAKAIGLAGWQIILYITLPQALRAVIPALVGQFISLFKDTSLVAIVGLFDLTGIAQAIVAQTEFLGRRMETYVFIIIVYFVFSYVMASISRRMEESGAGAARRI